MTGWRLAGRRLHSSGGCPKWLPKWLWLNPPGGCPNFGGCPNRCSSNRCPMCGLACGRKPFAGWMSKLPRGMSKLRGWISKVPCVHVRVAFWVSKGTGVWWRAKEASSRGERKRDTSHFVGDDWNDAGGTATQEQLPKSGVRPDEGEKQGTGILLYSSQVSRLTRIVVTVGFSPRD
jgi:hypothetical protein